MANTVFKGGWKNSKGLIKSCGNKDGVIAKSTDAFNAITDTAFDDTSKHVYGIGRILKCKYSNKSG